MVESEPVLNIQKAIPTTQNQIPRNSSLRVSPERHPSNRKASSRSKNVTFRANNREQQLRQNQLELDHTDVPLRNELNAKFNINSIMELLTDDLKNKELKLNRLDELNNFKDRLMRQITINHKQS